MSHEESDLEMDAFPDWQPVKFIMDGGRNAVELRNTQDQPRSRVQDGLKSVEKISIRPVENTVTMIDSACDEGMHERQQGLLRSQTSQMKVADLAELVHLVAHE